MTKTLLHYSLFGLSRAPVLFRLPEGIPPPFEPYSAILWCVAGLIAFLIYVQIWARENSDELGIDLVARLPTARVRLAAFSIGFLALCWFINVSFWAALLTFFVLGLIIGLMVAQTMEGGSLVFAGAFLLLREWAFDFPLLSLRPPTDVNSHANARQKELEQLVGQTGVASGPLRPFGNVELSGQNFPARSDSGDFLADDITVQVVAVRNGVLSVLPAEAASESLEIESSGASRPGCAGKET